MPAVLLPGEQVVQEADADLGDPRLSLHNVAAVLQRNGQQHLRVVQEELVVDHLGDVLDALGPLAATFERSSQLVEGVKGMLGLSELVAREELSSFTRMPWTVWFSQGLTPSGS